jgi:AcrR family transcriptional regulator
MLAPAAAPDIRQRILDAAQRITFSRGLSALRMAELSYELGMSKKTLYTYYPSKDALLAAMMDAHYQHYDGLFRTILDDPALSFLDRLQQTMRLGWEIKGVMSADVTQDFRRHAPALLNNFEQRGALAVQEHFRLLLEEGRGQGLLRKDLALDIVTDILMEAISYHLTSSNLQGRKYTLPEAFTTFYQLLFAGLLSDTARQQYLQSQ